VDALGNPTGFVLTPGQACGLAGADELLSALEADTLIADKGYDANQRVIEPWQQAGKTVVIPPKRNRKVPREYDRHLYQARHLIENFSANSSNSAPSPPAMTKPMATFWPPFFSLQPLSGSIEDTP